MKWWNTSWDPVVGCTPASPGCDNCYANALHEQRHAAFLAGKQVPACYSRPFGEVRCLPERLDAPLRWRKPRRVFVNSMSDLFHPDVPFEFLDRVFAVIAACSQHTFLVLTKRLERMLEYVSAIYSGRDLTVARRSMGMGLPEGLSIVAAIRSGPLPQLWLGVTAENQEQADARIPALLDTPTAKRFVSVEPMLGPVDLGGWVGTHDGPGLDWVICGGESGRNARPMHPDWAHSLRGQCAAAGVQFLFKQWGVGRSGRLLAGREHNDVPGQQK